MPDATDVRELLSQESGMVQVELLTLLAEGEAPGYMALSKEDVISRGLRYTATDLKFKPAQKNGEEAARAHVTFSNVSRELIAIIRDAHENPTVTAELIAASRPDHVIERAGPYELFNVSYTTNAIQADLGMQRVFDERFPHFTFNPAQSPAVHA